MQAETGKWYVRTLVNGQLIEFKFTRKPTQSDIDELVLYYESLDDETVTVEAENGEEI